jgi:hypothetical protein
MTDASDAIKFYSRLAPDQQIVLLARLAAAITVAARDTYVAGSEDVADAPRLRMFNEFQHQVTGQLRAIASGDLHRYPDEVFVKAIFAFAEDSGTGALIRELFELGHGISGTRKVG